LIIYTDGKTFGLPYDKINNNAKVRGKFTQSQVISPEEDIAINTLGFWVRKLGNPSTLNITLEQPEGTVHRFVVIDPSDVSIIYSWKQGSIQPFVLQKGETYYLRAKSPSSFANNYYELRHPSVDVGFSIDILNSTWGGTKSREYSSEHHDLTFRMNITAMPFAPVDNVAPTVDAGPDQTSNEGDPVTFSGSFVDPGADNHTIAWDFGDGASDSGTLTPSHVYADNGTYTVTLMVNDDGGVGTDTMTVTLTANDDGGVGTDTMTPTVNSSRSMIKDALAELKTISGLYEKIVKNEDKTAIARIEKNLDPDLWLDDDHLNAKHGHKVFDENKKAVKELMRLLDKKETSNEIMKIVQKTILKLVEADRRLANTLYAEVQGDTGDKKVDHELEKASQELLKAEEELNHVDKNDAPDPRYDKAIDHYKKAWEHCQHAIKHASI